MSKKVNVVETDVVKLHQSSQPVDMDNIGLVHGLYDMLVDAYKKLDGKLQGLAAIQVGMKYNAILLRFKRGEEPTVVYNPKVNFKFGMKLSNEGCMSEGNKRYLVKRPVLIHATYYTVENEKKSCLMTYKKARIFMHEYDHLFGILLQDHGIVVEG